MFENLYINDSFGPLKFNKNGNLVLHVMIYDVYEKRAVTYLRKHKAKVNTVDFSSDGRYLASGSDDFQLIIWDAKNGN